MSNSDMPGLMRVVESIRDKLKKINITSISFDQFSAGLFWFIDDQTLDTYAVYLDHGDKMTVYKNLDEKDSYDITWTI